MTIAPAFRTAVSAQGCFERYITLTGFDQKGILFGDPTRPGAVAHGTVQTLHMPGVLMK
jgi:hypothetical protein